jgi:two-component sensor histidine kinase
VGAIQQQLLGSGHGDPVYIGPYLSGLSQALAALMTDNSRLISLNVQAEDGTASSAEAVSIGLIVAELVADTRSRSTPVSDTPSAAAWRTRDPGPHAGG